VLGQVDQFVLEDALQWHPVCFCIPRRRPWRGGIWLNRRTGYRWRWRSRHFAGPHPMRFVTPPAMVMWLDNPKSGAAVRPPGKPAGNSRK
jgi:hypothetical protein